MAVEKKQVSGLPASLANAITFQRGQVKVTAPIAADATVTSSNTTTLPNSSGLIAYTDAADFVATMLIMLNGQVLTVGQSASDNNDVYPAGVAANGEFALETSLAVDDILIIMKFSAGV
jgi:hypothetical protein